MPEFSAIHSFQVILCALLTSEQWIHHLPHLSRNLKGTADRSLTSQHTAIMESQMAQPLWTAQRKMPHKAKLLLSLSLSLACSLGKLSGCRLVKYVNRLLMLVSFKHTGHILYNPCLDQNKGKFKTCHISIKRMFSSVFSICIHICVCTHMHRHK